MAAQTDRVIQQLEAQLAELKAQKEKEDHEANILVKVYDDLKNSLQAEEVSLETFFRYVYRDAKRVVSRVDRERAREEGSIVKPAPSTEKAPAPKKQERKRRKNKAPIKIPGGQYKNIPPNLDVIYTVKDKGPRPKHIRACAEEYGSQEKFFENCLVTD